MEEAWLMLLQPHSELVTRDLIGHSEVGGHGYIQPPSRWNNLAEEFCKVLSNLKYYNIIN